MLSPLPDYLYKWTSSVGILRYHWHRVQYALLLELVLSRSDHQLITSQAARDQYSDVIIQEPLPLQGHHPE